MFKGLGNIASLLKNAHNIGGRMEGVTDELRSKRVVGSAGGGLVRVVANGLGQVLSVEVDELLKENADLEMVVDLLPAAINDAMGKAKKLHIEAVQSITGDIPLPAGLENALKQLSGQAASDDKQPDG